jgi:hypothetical protein
MARSVECKCESNFTCGYCLRNAKPWHFTCSNGVVIPAVPVDLACKREDRDAQQSLADLEQSRDAR